MLGEVAHKPYQLSEQKTSGPFSQSKSMSAGFFIPMTSHLIFLCIPFVVGFIEIDRTSAESSTLVSLQ
jgi:hypothetical protein